jgi:hypothetical protein
MAQAGETLERVLAKLRDKAAELHLTPRAAEALYAIARDAYGIECEAAPSLIASALDIPRDEAKDVIIELQAHGVLVVSGSESPRYYADYGRLEVDEAEQATLMARRTPFVDQGAPHSSTAMAGLEDFLRERRGPVYVALEVTDPEIFRRFLRSRAAFGRRTVFLMPPKRELPEVRQRHYDETLKRWVQELRDGPADLRRSVDFRITATAFPDLYTSALSEDRARFDVRFLDSGTTRDGRIIEAKQGTSLYHTIGERYAGAVSHSSSLWRVWPVRATGQWFSRQALLPSLFVLALALSSFSYRSVAAGLAIGILANLLTRRLGVGYWSRPGLFKS